MWTLLSDFAGPSLYDRRMGMLADFVLETRGQLPGRLGTIWINFAATQELCGGYGEEERVSLRGGIWWGQKGKNE